MKKKKKDGNELDEFLSHKFLEDIGETLTVLQLREKLRQIDLDMNKKMAITEYLLFKFNKQVGDLVNAPQSSNKDEIEKAQKMVEDAKSKLEELLQKLEEQKKALIEQKRLEEELKKAEAENKAALEELHKQEKEYNDKVSSLEAKSTDSSLSTVQKNKAANELQQLKSEDPLPLRKAKINQGATVRKCEKASVEAQKQTLVVEQKKVEVEKLVEDANKKFDEAQNYFNEVKSRPGSAEGDLWFINRELTEAKKYLPQKKQ